MCQICSRQKSERSFYEGNNFKLCLTNQLLNVFKPWCEWGIGNMARFLHSRNINYRVARKFCGSFILRNWWFFVVCGNKFLRFEMTENFCWELIFVILCSSRPWFHARSHSVRVRVLPPLEGIFLSPFVLIVFRKDWPGGRGQLRLFAIGLFVRMMRAIVTSLPVKLEEFEWLINYNLAKFFPWMISQIILRQAIKES